MSIRERHTQAPITTRLEVVPQKPRKWVRNTAVGVAMTAGVVAYSHVDNAIDFFKNFPKIDLPNLFGNRQDPPPQAFAQIRPETYETEARFDISCKGRVSVGINDYGKKDERVADGVFDKVVFGDFLLCGDKGKILANARITTDAETGKVMKVVIETPGLEVTQPRVDHEDPKNCAKTKTSDTNVELNEKIQKMIADIKAGKKVKCDDGFRVTGLWGGADLANIIQTAHVAAQIAMSLDAQPGDIIEELSNGFFEDLRTTFEQRYPDAEVSVTQMSGLEAARERLNRVSEDLKRGFYDVEFGVKNGKAEMVVSAPNSGKATVQVRSVDMERAIIERIDEQRRSEPRPIFPPTIEGNLPRDLAFQRRGRGRKIRGPQIKGPHTQAPRR